MTDTIIIGAGFAALSAARVLASAGKKVVLLEARNRVGGRATTYYSDEITVDLGCAQIHGYKEGNPLKEVADGFRIPANVVEGAGVAVFGPNGQLAQAEGAALLTQSKSLGYVRPSPPPAASASLATTFLPTLPSPELASLARTIEIGAGVPLERISAQWFGYGRPILGTDGAPHGGYSRIINELVTEVKGRGTEVVLQAQVVKVEDEGTGVKVTTAFGETYSAKTIISTIPLGVLRKTPPEFSPPLSDAFTSALSRTENGTLEKVVLLYEKSKVWWPDAENTGTYFLLPTAETKTSYSSLAEAFESTTILVSNLVRTTQTKTPAILAYFGSAAGATLSDYSQFEIGAELHKYFTKRLGAQGEVAAPVQTLVTRWLDDPFARGATSAPTLIPTEKDTEVATPLDYVFLGRDEWNGRLGFAGEHTELNTRGSAAGAWISGEREGKRVDGLLNRLKTNA
ncbi:FAD/NAD(P)-binding domain-containing protein [Meredithblackwellia eburnea MCA 4105]